MAQWVRVLAGNPKDLEFNSQELLGGRREWAPASCPLTEPLHVYMCTYKQNKQIIGCFFLR